MKNRMVIQEWMRGSVRKMVIMTLMAMVLPLQLSAQSPDYKAIHDNYELKEVVVLSRHNIRAPLAAPNSILGKVTKHQWIEWSAKPSELTSRGGALETMMGQYFRQWLQHEGLFKEGTCPNVDEINIYANSMQRTIATAQYFSSGFSPTCGLNVNHRFAPSKMDPIFFPRLTKLSPAFEKEAMAQINQMGGTRGLLGWTETLRPSFQLEEKVLDMKNSPACQQENICGLNDYDTKMIFKLNEEPNLSGSLKLATKIADALILQYFEMPDDNAACWGNHLTAQQWELISKVKDVYGDILFTAPIVAVNVAHPLLQYMYDELNAKNRKLTYLVGHDSNVSSVTSALQVSDYSLPNTIEKKTPIGCKLVFEKWVDKKSGEEWIGINLVYQSTPQLRNMEILSLKNPPMVYQLKLNDMKANACGLYPFKEVNERFLKAIRAYDDIR